MSTDREIQYLHMRCNNLNARLHIALAAMNDLVNVQTQRLNSYSPEGQYYQSIADSCDSAINNINLQWRQVELEYQDVVNKEVNYDDDMLVTTPDK